MAKKKNTEETPDALEESQEDSAAYTSDREKAAEEHLKEGQELARQQFVFMGEDEPEIDIPDPEDRPVDGFSEAEEEALKTQNEIASEGYTPKTFEDYLSETKDSPDINPEAKEFQLPEFEAPDEFTGPEAAETAARTGFNPRTVATSTDPDGLADSEENVKEITGRSADSIRDEQGGIEPGEEPDEDEGSGADEVTPRVSKSSTAKEPNRIQK